MVSCNIVSFCLGSVIDRAYKSVNANPADFKAKAHETRGIGTTFLFKMNCAVQQVLRTGIWKPQTMYTSCYLRDITHKSMDAFFIGPLVASQQVM